jgi:hypothetical protein
MQELFNGKAAGTYSDHTAYKLQRKMGVVERLDAEVESFMSKGRDYVSELRPPTGPFFLPPVIHEWEKPRWNYIDTGNLKSRRKPVPVSLFPREIPHGLTQARTPVSVVRGR